LDQSHNHDSLDMIGGKRVIHIKINFVPRGLEPLETLFESIDVPLKPSIKPKLSEVEDYSLSTIEESQFV
jgi:hypothetical protein